jgi:hypothetical protein
MHQYNLPSQSANGQGNHDAQIDEYLCTCMALSIHPLELGIQIPGKSGNRQPLILPQAHHDFLHHQSISLAPPPLAKSQEDSKAEVYQSAHSDLLFFLSLL